MSARALLAAALLSGAAGAGPTPELIREERFNYRIVGELPRGWKRVDELRPSWTYVVEGVPHGHVMIFRQRVEGDVDVAEQVAGRSPQYRFPGAPDDAPEKTAHVEWAGGPALRYEHEARIQRTRAVRRVTAAHRKSIWYELFETAYGDTADDPAFREGVRVLRDGFRLLAPPVPESELADETARVYEDADLGFTLRKPEGFRRLEVDTGADPGCRLAFERRGPGPRDQARLRLFEYGLRPEAELSTWHETFFGAFASLHDSPERERVELPAIEGAAEMHAELYTGEREDVSVRTVVILARAASGRLFCVRLRLRADAPAPELELKLR